MRDDVELALRELPALEPADPVPGQSIGGRYAILERTMASDREIIDAVLRGDVERYAELVDRYQQTARQLAFSMLGNHEDAKDASQEAFVNAYRSLRHFRGGARFSTWLYRIVVNECKDVYRQRSRQPAVVVRVGEPDPGTDGLSLFTDVEDPTIGPADQLANRELGRRLSGAIRMLPMKQRTTFVLHHLHGLTLEEVASIMRCRLGTVKSHVFRATQQLRAQLGPWLAKEDA